TAKGIAIGPLSAPAAGERLADAPLAFASIEHPRACLPRWLVAQVLGMAAGQIDHPVAVLVLVEPDDPTDGALLVRRAFAFRRCLGYTCSLYILLQKVLPHADRRQQGCL